MFLAGLFYLAFEQTISKGSGHPISVAGSRIIMGIQVFREPLDM
jgi:phosphatidylinositol glycan class N